MSKIIVIYHSNCADGFTAAWAARKKFGNDAEYFPAVHQAQPPDVTGKDVVLVDFSYKLEVLREMAKSARSILVLDHHKSAAEDLAQDRDVGDGIALFRMDHWEGELSWERHKCNVYQDECEGARFSNIYAYFDMDRSGAGIAWDFFNPGVRRPALVNHIEDRDLWRFALPGTREINATVFSYPYYFDVWDVLASTGMDALREQGAAIERKHHKDVAELVGVCKRRMTIGGHDIPVASLPYTLTSDAGHMMAQGEPFAACYWDVEDGRVFSLRSADDGLDVSEIAVQYGGGGHAKAAGFKVPRDHELARC